MCKHKKVIITGATSFIGNALIRRLVADEQYDIYAIVRPNSSRLASIDRTNRVTIVEAQLDELDSLKIGDLEYADIVFHIGWTSDFTNPRYNLEGQLSNVDYVEKTIEMAKRYGCGKVLCVGSQAECGRVEGMISEMTPDHPETAYAIAKCKAYEKGMELCERSGINFYWPRLLSAYGPNDKMHTMIMSCLQAAIFKQDIQFTKCEQIWDYVYVDDVADALVRIVEAGTPGIKYSIASGCGRELRDYITDIAFITGNTDILKAIGLKPYVENQVMYLVGDISRLKQDTGFLPKTSFEEGIKETIKYNFR